MNIQFDNTTLNTDHIIYLKQDNSMFGENFYLGSTPCNTFTLKLAKTYIVNDPTNVTITINNSLYATLRLVDKSFDDTSIIYTLEDKMTLFDVNYSAKDVIEENGGEATLKQILQDICTKCGVTLATNTFSGENIKVGIYDSSRTARKYISYIAEINGGYAIINKQGQLELRKYTNTSVKTIDIDSCSDFKIGEHHTITRVVYDNGLVKYEHGNGETLYVQSDNPYMTQEAVDTIYTSINGFSFYSYTTTNAPIDSTIDNGKTITFSDGTNSYPTIAVCNYIFNGGLIGGYSLEINSSAKTETGKTGNNEEYRRLLVNQDLTNASIKILAEETERTLTTYKNATSTSIDLNDSGDYPVNMVKLDGEYKQDTRSGKNLLNPFQNYSAGYSQTTNGITFTLNNDGTITVNGTATATAVFSLYGTWSGTTSYLDLDISKTYQLRNFGEENSNVIVFLRSLTNGTYKTHNSSDVISRVLSGIEKIILFSVQINSGATVNNYVIKPQLEQGSTATSYEPYGVMPSPDYPSEVEVIDGYNLFDEEYELGTINYYTGALENSSTIIRTKNYQKIQPSTSYSITLPTEVTGIILYYYNNGVFVRAVQPSISNHTVSFTTLSTANQVKWRFNSNYITLENQTMLVKGSQASPYLPYGSIAVKCEGKNLLKLNSSNLTFNRYIGNDGTYKTSTSGNYYASEEYLDFSNYKGNNITISNGLEIAFYTSNKTFISYVGRLLPRTQQVPNNCGFIRIDCYKDNINTMQIEKGSTATTYEEYKSNTMQIALQNNFIGKLPNGVKDELQVLNGNVILTKRVGKVVLDGSESWSLESVNGINFKTLINDAKGNDDAVAFNCNYFKAVTGNQSYSGNIDNCIGIGSSKNLRVRRTQWSTVNDFKTWLSTHNTIVYYELAEPQTINLGRVDMLQTYDNISHITQIDNLQGNLFVEYQTNSSLNENYASRDELNTNIDGINDNLSNYVTNVTLSSQLEVNKNEILGDVSRTYVTTGELGTTTERLQGLISQKADSTTITSISQQVYDSNITGIQTTVHNVEENFTFNTNGLTIGRNDSQIKLNLQNDKIKFIEGSTDDDDAYMTKSQFVLQELQEFRLGKFAFIPRTNGSLDFKKVN